MWELQGSIPKRFLKGTRAEAHRFLVCCPSRSLRPHGERGEGSKGGSQLVARCRFRSRDGDVEVHVSCARDPRIARAILALGSLARNGHRPTKYLAVYQAYEELASTPRGDLAALRHAMAHNPGALTRRRTIEQLESLFGTTDIDLEGTRHQRVFWSLFGELLIEVDEAISGVLQDWIDELRGSETPTNQRLCSSGDTILNSG